MEKILVAAKLTLACLLAACGSTHQASGIARHNSPDQHQSNSPTTSKDTILLVSLGNGSVIMQTIDADADVCFKKNSDSATTCFKQGEPVINPETNAVIGFEMIENQIQLIAKYD